MNKFLQFSFILGITLGLSGCWCETPVIPDPPKIHVPKFPIDEFEKAKDFDVKYIVQENNNTIEIIMNPKDFKSLLMYSKQNKEELNLLIQRVEDWNLKLENFEKEFSE